MRAFKLLAPALFIGLICSPATSASDPERFEPDDVMECVYRAGNARNCQNQIVRPCSSSRSNKSRYGYGDCLGALLIKWRSISAERSNAARFKMPLSEFKAAERAVKSYQSDMKTQCKKEAAKFNSQAKTEALRTCELMAQVTAATAMRNPELIQAEIDAQHQANGTPAQSKPETQSRWKKIPTK